MYKRQVEDFDEEEIAAMYAAAQAKAAAEMKAEDDRLIADAHIPVKVKFNLAGSKFKIDRVGPLSAEVPASVWEEPEVSSLDDDKDEDVTGEVDEDYPISNVDAAVTTPGKKRARPDDDTVAETRQVNVFLNGCAYVPPRTALLCNCLLYTSPSPRD